MTQENSLRISFLKFVCAIFVVALHAYALILSGDVGSWTWFLDNILVDGGLCRIAVPFFFLCSGYFLAKHLGTRQEWWGAIKKRMHTLVIPFFIWNWIFVVYLIIVRSATDIFLGRPLGTTVGELDWLSILGVNWVAPLLNPLWYVRNLFFLVLLAPIIFFFVRKLGRAWLVLCLLGAIFYWMIPGEKARHFWYCFFSLSGLFYFSLGLYLFQNKRELNFTSNRLMCVWASLLVLLLLGGMLFFEAKGFGDARRMLEAIVIPVMIFLAWHFAPAYQLPNWLCNVSFPIFILHPFFGSFLSNTMKHGNILRDYPRVRGSICFVIGIFASIIVAHLLRRYCPRFAKLAFGER